MTTIPTDLESVSRAVKGLLEGYVDRPVRVREQKGRAEPRADLLVDIGGHRFAAEVKSSGRTATVRQAAEEARVAAEKLGAQPLVVVPYMGERGADLCRRLEVAYMDLSGNAFVRDRDLLILVQGQPNKFPEMGRPSSPFASRSARVTRLLLLDPSRFWQQQELASATRLDKSTVSRAVRRLDDDSLLEWDGDRARLRPSDPSLLLDAWSEAYRFDRHNIMSFHVANAAGADLARQVGRTLAGTRINYALTGLGAAWLYERFASFRLVSTYVASAKQVEQAARKLRARPLERGANLQLIVPDDAGVFDGSGRVEGIECVAPVQAYLDLLALPERAREAAAELRQRRLWG